MAVQEHPPVPGFAVGRRTLGANAGRAIIRQRIIPLGVRVQLIDATEIIKEKCPPLFRRHLDAVETRFFALPIICPQPHHIAFVGDDVAQFKLAEQAFDRRIVFAFFFARLDGKTNIVAIGKTEAHHRVRDVRRTPGDQIQIHRAQRREVKCLVVVLHREVRLRAVIAVADVVDDHLITVDIGVRQHCQVG